MNFFPLNRLVGRSTYLQIYLKNLWLWVTPYGSWVIPMGHVGHVGLGLGHPWVARRSALRPVALNTNTPCLNGLYLMGVISFGVSRNLV